MNHEAFHELLALRLYGELSPGETNLLEAHLESCGTCTAFASELEATLGQVTQVTERAAASSGELPADWSERLRAATREEPAPRRLQPLAIFGAGLAAGLLVMASLRTTAPPPGGPSPPGVSITRSTNAGEDPSFAARSTPPPQATSGGSLARLATLLGR